MEPTAFKPYHFLVQLIPGSFLLGIILLAESGTALFDPKLSAMGITLFIAGAFLVGYIANGAGHLLENAWSWKLDPAIQRSLQTPAQTAWLLRPFRWCSIVKRDERLQQNAKTYPAESRAWSKEEKKFARTMMVVAIGLIAYLCDNHLRIYGIRYDEQLIGWLVCLLLIAVYRYFVSSMEYAYKQGRKTGN